MRRYVANYILGDAEASGVHKGGSGVRENLKHVLCISEAIFSSGNCNFPTHKLHDILTNAQKHDTGDSAEGYSYSAYHALIVYKPTLLLRQEVLNWLGGRNAFMTFIRHYKVKPDFPAKLPEREEDEAGLQG